MTRLDLRRELRHLYHASAQVSVVQVPAFTFLMVDGQGDPNHSPAYVEAVEALFSVSYAARFLAKRTGLADYAVMPLEGLWWADDLTAFERGDRAQWRWTMMILQPECVLSGTLHTAIDQVAQKKSLPGLARLRIDTFEEGHCAQILHVGPFSEEGPTIQRLHAWIDAHGRRRGRHHEIYLTDIRRAAPARWKTIIRQSLE